MCNIFKIYFNSNKSQFVKIKRVNEQIKIKIDHFIKEKACYKQARQNNGLKQCPIN